MIRSRNYLLRVYIKMHALITLSVYTYIEQEQNYNGTEHAETHDTYRLYKDVRGKNTHKLIKIGSISFFSF